MKGPLIILNPCAQSHPFEERRCRVGNAQDPLKIGRSVARLKPSGDNAIFDCKVLSRNHAILWYSNSSFWLKDTKSSNGTFVNNDRLAQTGEDSEPRQINTGDIIQFGVEIVENANKISHGCILAMVRLFDENGEEVEIQASTLQASQGNQGPGQSVLNSQQLFQMQQFLKEALLREKYRDEKIQQLEGQLTNADLATENAWKSFLNEDRLLAKIAILEEQLSVYHKNKNVDSIRYEMDQLLADKAKFTVRAREDIVKAQEQRAEAELRLNDTERSLVSLEEDFQIMKQKYDSLMQYNTSMGAAMEELKNENKRLTTELEMRVTVELAKTNLQTALQATYDILPSKVEDEEEDEAETSVIQANFDKPTTEKAASDEDLKIPPLQATFLIASEKSEKMDGKTEESSNKEKENNANTEALEQQRKLQEQLRMLLEAAALHDVETAALRAEITALRNAADNEPTDPTSSPRSSSRNETSSDNERRLVAHQDNAVLLSIIPVFSMVVLFFSYVYNWIARKIGLKQD